MNELSGRRQFILPPLDFTVSAIVSRYRNIPLSSPYQISCQCPYKAVAQADYYTIFAKAPRPFLHISSTRV